MRSATQPTGGSVQVSMKINGANVSHDVEPRTLLVHFIRENAGLTGTNIGCDSSSCGACTIHINGESVKSCTVFAAQADGADILTIEGLADGDTLHPMQQAFHECHALQCGYCTPGMVMATIALLRAQPDPSTEDIAKFMARNVCRCGAYPRIVSAVKLAASRLRTSSNTRDRR